MEKPSPEQIANIQKVLSDIKRLGPKALFAQYCVWANFHVETANDLGLGAAELRTTQLLPLCVVVMKMAGIGDDAVERVQAALHDSVLRALWRAKLAGRHAISIDDAEHVLPNVIKQLTP